MEREEKDIYRNKDKEKRGKKEVRDLNKLDENCIEFLINHMFQVFFKKIRFVRWKLSVII